MKAWGCILGVLLLASACAPRWERLEADVVQVSDGKFAVQLWYSGERLRAFDDGARRGVLSLYIERCDQWNHRFTTGHRPGSEATYERREGSAILRATFHCEDRYRYSDGGRITDWEAVDWNEACLKSEVYDVIATARATTRKGALREAAEYCQAMRRD